MKKIAVLMMSMTILSACNSRYASNGDQLYENSHNGRSLVVPSPLTNGNINHFYDLPRQDKHEKVSIEPPADPKLPKQDT